MDDCKTFLAFLEGKTLYPAVVKNKSKDNHILEDTSWGWKKWDQLKEDSSYLKQNAVQHMNRTFIYKQSLSSRAVA